jgi:hypothetical protein
MDMKTGQTLVLITAAALVGYLAHLAATTWLTLVLGLAYLAIAGALLTTMGGTDARS